jgi:hypothetical protein
MTGSFSTLTGVADYTRLWSPSSFSYSMSRQPGADHPPARAGRAGPGATMGVITG